MDKEREPEQHTIDELAAVKIEPLYFTYFDEFIDAQGGIFAEGYIYLYSVEKLDDNDELVKYNEMSIEFKDSFHRQPGEYSDASAVFEFTSDMQGDYESVEDALSESIYIELPKDKGVLIFEDIEFHSAIFSGYVRAVLKVADKLDVDKLEEYDYGRTVVDEGYVDITPKIEAVKNRMVADARSRNEGFGLTINYIK